MCGTLRSRLSKLPALKLGSKKYLSAEVTDKGCGSFSSEPAQPLRAKGFCAGDFFLHRLEWRANRIRHGYDPECPVTIKSLLRAIAKDCSQELAKLGPTRILHEWTVVHGVTPLWQGVRFSLFLLQSKPRL